MVKAGDDVSMIALGGPKLKLGAEHVQRDARHVSMIALVGLN